MKMSDEFPFSNKLAQSDNVALGEAADTFLACVLYDEQDSAVQVVKTQMKPEISGLHRLSRVLGYLVHMPQCCSIERHACMHVEILT